MMREVLSGFLLGLIATAAFEPRAAAGWFVEFQSAVFEKQMEAME